MRRALLVRGGRVLDLDGDLDRPPEADVLIEGTRIAAVGPGAAEQAEALGAEILDATGHLVVPGFVNAHYHSHDVLLRGCFEQLPFELWALVGLPPAFPRRSPEEVRLRTVLGAVECLQGGITTVQDMVTIVGPDREHVDAFAQAYSETGLAAVVALQVADRPAADTVPFWRTHLPPDLRARFAEGQDLGALQAFVRQTMGEVSAPGMSWALAPSAPQRCSAPLLRWAAALSAEAGLPVFTHAYETRGQAVLARLDYAHSGHSLIGWLEEVGLLNARLTLAHGVWLTDTEIARVGAAGVNVSVNAISNLKLMNGVAPVRAYARAGAGLAIGCDNCSCSDVQNMFQAMKMFALYWGLQGEAGETGAAREAFRAATLGGARALGLDGIAGAVRPGYRADLVLISLDDPAWRPLNSALRQLVYAETGRGVRTVLAGGRIVVRYGRLTGFDEAALTQAAERMRERVAADLAAAARVADGLRPELLKLHAKALAYPLDIDRYRLDGR